MISKWHFREFKPGDNASDPDFARALFSRDAEGILARSVVRESIQNSLDARSTKTGSIRVRFVLRTGAASASPAAVARFFDGAWDHLHGKGTGLEQPPTLRDPVPFLVVEDFGTKGLTGDPAHWDPFDSNRNSFFLFFRALGRSGKENEDRGRWGVGKFVFPLASRGHCLLGYTVPVDTGQPLLMGRMVLKTHRSGGISYHPDGHLGLRDGSSGLVMPESDPTMLDEVRRVFSLDRTTEPGLSVIVPWLITELDGTAILQAVVTEYFLPILRSELVVEIDDNGKVERIDAQKVETLASAADPAHVRALLSLGVQAATWPANQIIVLPDTASHREYAWDDDRIPEDVRSSLFQSLDRGQPIAVRVPLTIEQNESPLREKTFFDVFIQRVSGLGRQRPLIVREGITIPEGNTAALQDHVALVIVDDGPLASLVGDAETPAHTQLQNDLIKNKYKRSGKVLTLIRNAAAEVQRSVDRLDREDDSSLLAEFFPLDVIDDDHGRRRSVLKKRKGQEPEPFPVLPPSRPRFRVTKIDRGFRVNGTGEGELPEMLTIRFAYDVRRGNAFKGYSPFDFSLAKGDITLASSGVSLIEERDNVVVVGLTEPFFSVEIAGFDTHRDVVVRVDASTREALA